MTHKAKKLRAGEYEYRGYVVRNASEDVGYTMWNITPAGDQWFAVDAANSFAQAKAMVDAWYSADANHTPNEWEGA